MTTNNHPANGPVSLDRLHQISEILSNAAAQSDGGNLGYAMADAVKVIDGVIAAFGAEPHRNPVLAYADSYRDMAKRGVESIPVWSVITDLERNIAPLFTAPPAPVVQPVMFIDGDISASDAEKLAAVIREWDDAPAPERDQVRRDHAAWSQATFGNVGPVGPVGPLKHLSKEAQEAAAEPGDLSEWADMQFLLWDAQRRAGISDEQITQAMVEKLAVNKQREWPEPKDGEPRLHIKEQPAPVVPEGLRMALSNAGIAAPESDEMLAATHEKYIQTLVTWVKDRKPFQPASVVPEEIYWQDAPVEGSTRAAAYATGWNACRAAMLQAGNHTEQHLDMVDHSGDSLHDQLSRLVTHSAEESAMAAEWDRPTPKSDLRQLAEKIADDVQALIKRLPDSDQGGA